jgi:hypothetical protein
LHFSTHLFHQQQQQQAQTLLYPTLLLPLSQIQPGRKKLQLQ